MNKKNKRLVSIIGVLICMIFVLFVSKTKNDLNKNYDMKFKDNLVASEYIDVPAIANAYVPAPELIVNSEEGPINLDVDCEVTVLLNINSLKGESGSVEMYQYDNRRGFWVKAQNTSEKKLVEMLGTLIAYKDVVNIITYGDDSPKEGLFKDEYMKESMDCAIKMAALDSKANQRLAYTLKHCFVITCK